LNRLDAEQTLMELVENNQDPGSARGKKSFTGIQFPSAEKSAAAIAKLKAQRPRLQMITPGVTDRTNTSRSSDRTRENEIEARADGRHRPVICRVFSMACSRSLHNILSVPSPGLPGKPGPERTAGGAKWRRGGRTKLHRGPKKQPWSKNLTSAMHREVLGPRRAHGRIRGKAPP